MLECSALVERHHSSKAYKIESARSSSAFPGGGGGGGALAGQLCTDA